MGSLYSFELPSVFRKEKKKGIILHKGPSDQGFIRPGRNETPNVVVTSALIGRARILRPNLQCKALGNWLVCHVL